MPSMETSSTSRSSTSSEPPPSSAAAASASSCTVSSSAPALPFLVASAHCARCPPSPGQPAQSRACARCRRGPSAPCGGEAWQDAGVQRAGEPEAALPGVAPAPVAPAPVGMTWPSTRSPWRSRADPPLLGGMPRRLLRLSPRGAGLVSEWAAGGSIGLDPAERRFARRLLDAGLAHPVGFAPGDAGRRRRQVSVSSRRGTAPGRWPASSAPSGVSGSRGR